MIERPSQIEFVKWMPSRNAFITVEEDNRGVNIMVCQDDFVPVIMYAQPSISRMSPATSKILGLVR